MFPEGRAANPDGWRSLLPQPHGFEGSWPVAARIAAHDPPVAQGVDPRRLLRHWRSANPPTPVRSPETGASLPLPSPGPYAGYWAAMSRENVETLRAVYARWERGDLTASLPLFAENLTLARALEAVGLRE